MAKILIVDDKAIFRESLRDMVHTRFPSLQITEAKDGGEALSKVDALMPDLVFMDLSLALVQTVLCDEAHQQ